LCEGDRAKGVGALVTDLQRNARKILHKTAVSGPRMANGRVDPGHNNGASVIRALAKEEVKESALKTVFKHGSIPIDGVSSLLNDELGNGVKSPQCFSANHELPSASGVGNLRHELKERR